MPAQMANKVLMEFCATRRVFVASNDDIIFPDDWPFTTTTAGPGGAIDSMTFTDPSTGFTYKQTYTFSGGGLQITQSQWVKQ